ncbi:TIGR00730 family Rossman fold protein [Legionella oakridgensis]|uniref:Cytokinin riboside 5'-monophosphate phosphoribohydrolase n=2 Tax=Legionella oakridgensis TaxID=29423 RepID=W0BF31_9GAMM|nr:TIGR00730 family Rossman fold protein [Legionella oakridgensis]AHE67044.1 hypothetical protein Loa_01493 [Legionella oakridgensis ATCC 33761 = DSM 21215]ETO93329.1 hypothetical protein LOR_79c23070 [Legionella oakridgensis RV-2-2007]KTD37194.1 lysine decarboxylase [Legionella oakridgensis]STY20138.1 lysine decarboxylase [Legionella longbeachae]
MKSICVYLGANLGQEQAFSQCTVQMGQELVRRNYRLVYGGSSHGLMGILANTVLDCGGKVTGIIPKHLIAQEEPLETLDELFITENMQERKLMMQQHSDAFIVMPGGLGTLEEAFETWDAIKIGVVNKPLGFLNVGNFYDGLFSFITHCVHHKFISQSQMRIPKIHSNPTLLLNDMFEQSLETLV